MHTSLDVVVPVLNEARALPLSIGKLHDFLSINFSDHNWQIVIADNGSIDSTQEVAKRLLYHYSRIRYIRLELRGRGRALRKAWMESEADILCYTDVDLSTDMGALSELIVAVEDEGYDIAIGSRLKKGADVIGRSVNRELISRTYSLMFRTLFRTGFQDAQCGFKALTRRSALKLLPWVQDTGWFFDTELLILAEKNGYRIKEVPVRWTDDQDSRVKVLSTAYRDIKGLLRLRFGGLRKVARALSKHC